MPAEKKLLPCPWCGGIPEVNKHFREDMYSLLHRCPVMGPLSLDWSSEGDNEARWNQRANTKEQNGHNAQQPQAVNPSGNAENGTAA